MKDYGQSKQILEDLKKINNIKKEEIEFNDKLKSGKNFKIENFESDKIEIKFPIEYKEEEILKEVELNFIEGHQSKLKVQLLGERAIFTLTIEVEQEYYEKCEPKFSGYFMIFNEQKYIDYSGFGINYYDNGIFLLSVEIGYDRILSSVDFDKESYIKIFIIKNSYFSN